MKLIRLFLSVFFTCTFAAMQLCGQVFTNKEVGKKNSEMIDSLKKVNYPYSLPILGAKATKAGYNLPYSAGVSVQYFTQHSDLVINNLQVGFNNGPQYNLDGLVRFNKASSTASAVTIRPDIWLLPFLNVYGVFGKSKLTTDVGWGLWIPDSTNTAKQIFSSGSKVNFNATSMGLGITPTIGVGGGFLALDMNFTWTDIPALEKPAFSFVFGPRLGKSFNLKKPDRSIAVWVGGFRVALNTGTSGTINVNEVFNVDELENKIQTGYEKVGNAQQQVDTWWAGLTQLEQKNPANIAKYKASNKVLETAGNVLNAADNAINNGNSATIQYALDKQPKEKWNFIVGSQFQLNKHFMLRAEYGFIGNRKQFLTGIQYRFGL